MLIRSQVDTIDSVDTHAWDTYVGQCSQATHYHLSGWGRIIQCVYGYPCLYFTAWDGETLCGILPVVSIGGSFRRKSFVSMPYLDYGGICAETPDVTDQLYRAVQRVITDRRAGLLDLRHRGATVLPLAPYGDKVTMVLRLEPEPERIWGAREESLHWQANVPGGDLLSTERHQALTGVVEAWKYLPLGVTRIIGPFLRRRLSN